MESLNPTPRLFMRSVNIMVNNAAAPLVKWVLELLQRLITKQVGVLVVQGLGCNVQVRGPISHNLSQPARSSPPLLRLLLLICAAADATTTACLCACVFVCLCECLSRTGVEEQDSVEGLPGVL